MLFTVQFPFADCRKFQGGETGLISRPTWPSPIIGEFVRCFGGVRERVLGGVQFWGENYICEAHRALRFDSLPHFITSDKQTIPIEVAFRRLYSDGLAVGKFEIGLATVGRQRKFNGGDAKAFLAHLLAIKVGLGSTDGQSISTLADAATPLLNAFTKATTRFNRALDGIQQGVVESGSPVLFLQRRAEEWFPLPFFTYSLEKQYRTQSISIECCLIPYRGRNLRLWVLTFDENADRQRVRALRLSLLRLHAEHECIRLVCRNIVNQKIRIKYGSKPSEDLQLYLNSATRRIALGERKASESEAGDPAIVELTRSIAEAIHPGERDSLLDSLKRAKVRKNIVNKVAKYAQSVIVAEEVIMSNDKYEIHGGAGAVGPNATAHNVNIVNYQQAWDGLKGQIDVAALSTQLVQLVGELRNRAQNPEEFRALAEVASASEAAKVDDGSKALQHLKSAGTWALGIAEKVGVSLAAKAIQSAIGL